MLAKWLITDDVVVIGSCNFSAASQLNIARGVRLRGIPREDMAREREDFDDLYARGVALEADFGAANTREVALARSAPVAGARRRRPRAAQSRRRAKTSVLAPPCGKAAGAAAIFLSKRSFTAA